MEEGHGARWRMLFKGDEGTRLLGHAPKNKDIMVQEHHDVHQ